MTVIVSTCICDGLKSEKLKNIYIYQTEVTNTTPKKTCINTARYCSTVNNLTVLSMLGQYYTVWDSGEFEKQEKDNEVFIKVNEWKMTFFVWDSRENKVSSR